ncbi:HAD family hydrolase [Flavobacterium piscinae]|uniref:HAD hydrolase-like protein n=1 Tax=Flavobacterium piscinae TaxID=2506424 RepID=UPI0019CB7293|nr:HAD hydrolase-like protein [Flavobacterium piscinae]MBC8884109.1 HAD family hydrolase [Flavobacterium piscinae]
MKAIIFDIDGTLTNTTEVDDKCFKNAFKDIFEVDISNQSWDCIENVTDFGITEEIVHKQLGRLPTINEYQKMISRFVELLNNELKYDKSQFDEIDGATQFLRFISQKSNIAIGIATGGWKKSANLKLKAIGVNSKATLFQIVMILKKRRYSTRNYETIKCEKSF